MTDTRNPRKRKLKEGSTKITVTPPAKKRRISAESKKKSTKDLTKWTIKDLKRYLKQNGVTFQMNKDKAYYIRLATRIAREDKQNETNEKPNSSETANRISSHQNEASQNETLPAFDNTNSSNSDSSNSPLFETPRRATPPLPANLSRAPLTDDRASEGEDDSDVEEEDQNETDLAPNSYKTQAIPRPAAVQLQSDNPSLLQTPQSAKSRPMIERVTPLSSEARDFNDNNGAFRGPFQEIGSLKRYRFQSDFKRMFGGVQRRARGAKSKYFVFLVVAVCLILMTLCIPYVVTLFVTTPFCDTDSDTMSGTYSVLYGMIPLENKIECALCPFEATCDGNGGAKCAEGYGLDEYKMVCLAANDSIARAASHVAHEANIVLGKQLGDYECSWRDGSVNKEMSEDELKQSSAGVAREYYVNTDGDEEDDDGSLCDGQTFVESDEDEKQLFVDKSWDYARDHILAAAYKKSIIVNSSSYSSLREIPTSFECKMVLLYRYYSEKEHYNECVIQLGFIGIAMAALVIVAYLRKTSNDSDNNEAIMAANFVLQKLSQQQQLHFSIEQFKHYTMRHHKISIKTWKKAVDYINQSTQIAKITEQVDDGALTICWKWKSPVPFVPL
eukprot:239373_1